MDNFTVEFRYSGTDKCAAITTREGSITTPFFDGGTPAAIVVHYGLSELLGTLEDEDTAGGFYDGKDHN